MSAGAPRTALRKNAGPLRKVAVLASDSDTLEGWGGTLALVDELARHQGEENFGLLRDGLGPRNGHNA